MFMLSSAMTTGSALILSSLKSVHSASVLLESGESRGCGGGDSARGGSAPCVAI
jgi:hypothetical protein